ncbi:acylphosphatase [Emiliania huxleyi CCMP1516]|uniref:acylphosphatase n=2 Tax=Emiliania huxleyi TaxID=2903 RepID=A0A0D3KPW8_EMIH1|nr:hypothetical protein EMIHUDRAFT_256835 [Emiliania huxleyi CCMP1516]XP_005790232.1 acylphosphatase [Emiliania huxleyi CCMP1516]EOD13385.1 hypothetical protein EMIHUDRAFT_256835 [Emiliania huxleyi CCMP1516]EOD37803.1 acylphosphatase [Emiliania huxleyi CCMP1516]|mmetsp:Transcript_34474/g.102987  ORF Transcript_34474/g.102987 Transcript_34474/m.102987 type:complete len:120 (+) Transcript_34474:82-441(+)|eukprot:XP_005765814.1 hypothetical protein EMIHUDRAFT_256835 [Emiliania huxleyi CCMP1516]
MSKATARLSRAHIFVSGRVQGVYYRDTTKAKGERLGLTGVAYNLADKRVEIVAEGPKAAIETLVEWCWKGPEGAHEVGFSNKLTRKRHVSGVEVRWELEEELGAAHQYAGFLNGGTKSS